MIAGEHAVLHGHSAIVGTLKQRLQVTLEPRSDEHVVLHSPSLGGLKVLRSKIKASKPFQYVLAALENYQDQLPGGVTISIHSNFSHKVGFGSSAAVTVATIAVLRQWLGLAIAKKELLQEGRELVQRVQGLGSGADIAASVYGGVIWYEPKELHVETLPALPSASLYYVGYKKATAEVLQQLEQQRQANPQQYASYFELIGDLVMAMKQALQEQRWQDLAANFSAHHLLQRQLGTSDANIESLRAVLAADAGIWATKISGSGLGDCVLAIGKPQNLDFTSYDCEQLRRVISFPVEISEHGVEFGQQ